MITKARRERLKLRKTQAEIAAAAGISQAELSEIENLRRLPFRPVAERLATVLGLSPNELQELAPPIGKAGLPRKAR